MKWIVDRIEDGFAVIEAENGKTYDIPLDAFGEEIKENDVITLSADSVKTEQRKEEIESLMDDLFI